MVFVKIMSAIYFFFFCKINILFISSMHTLTQQIFNAERMNPIQTSARIQIWDFKPHCWRQSHFQIPGGSISFMYYWFLFFCFFLFFFFVFDFSDKKKQMHSGICVSRALFVVFGIIIQLGIIFFFWFWFDWISEKIDFCFEVGFVINADQGAVSLLFYLPNVYIALGFKNIYLTAQ